MAHGVGIFLGGAQGLSKRS